jgi:hypothetical protein
LDRFHPYQKDWVTFDGQQEVRLEPPKVSTSDFFKRAKEKVRWLNMRTCVGDDRKDLIRSHSVKRKHIFSNYHIGRLMFLYNLGMDY